MHTITATTPDATWLTLNFNGAWDGDLHINWKGGEAWCDAQALLRGVWRKAAAHVPTMQPPIEIWGRAIALAIITYYERGVKSALDALSLAPVTS
jgi:hypothetical protein